LYYAFSKDCKNSGLRHAIATNSTYDPQDQGALQFRGLLANAPGVGTTVGNIKFTWYIRFHGRTRTSNVGRITAQRESDKENQEPQASEMSYADLQAQVAQMMGNRK